MTTQPALARETVQGIANLDGGAPGGAAPRRPERPDHWTTTPPARVCSLTVLVPLYVTVSMAFKTTEQAVDGNAFSLPAPISSTASRGVGASRTSRGRSPSRSSSRRHGRRHDHPRRARVLRDRPQLGAAALPLVVLLPARRDVHPVPGRGPRRRSSSPASLGLDNPAGVTILHIMFQLSFSILLFTAFLRSIPIELEESARIDGATTWQTFWQLIFPLLAPMSATVGIFAFLASWNDFMMPSLIIADPTQQTLPVVQTIFQTQFSNNYNVSFASYLMAMAPAIIVYIFTQRWVMAGVTQGAVKG